MDDTSIEIKPVARGKHLRISGGESSDVPR